jgi:hypothetical protein
MLGLEGVMPSKYDPLRDYLSGQTEPTLTLTFRHIEKILGFALPAAARRHSAWWANGSRSHSHAKAWTSKGRRASPDLTAEAVQFSTSRREISGTSKPNRSATDIKVAAEVWAATALLHREHPDSRDFGISEIVARAEKENIAGRLRPGVYQHVVSHAVANRPPSPNRYRYLFATASDRRRLCRLSDPTDPGRLRSNMLPDRNDLPERYRPLLEWYRTDYVRRGGTEQDPILALIGLGKEIWKGVDADEYVRQLREEWD